jgi:hypothetical protein
MLNQVNNWLTTGGGIKKLTDFLVLLFGVGALSDLGLSIRSLYRHNGAEFTVLYLKECKRVVEHYCSGEVLNNTISPPFVGLRKGLPSFLPADLRSRIRGGDRVGIMLTLTLLGLYRGLVVPPKVKVETITNGYSGESDHLMGFSDTVERFLGHLQIGKLKKPRLWLSTSVGPHGMMGAVSAIRDAASLLSGVHETIRLFQEEYASAVYGRRYRIWFSMQVRFFACVHRILYPSWIAQTGETSWLSRLHRIEEPAGKVRIVAITDYWTQLLMKPVHNLVFDILRTIPQDGTFDQEACVTRLRDSILARLGGHGKEVTVYSYDLSAATDRMPVHLYQELLSHIIGFEEATLWKHLLTARKWWDRDSVWSVEEGLRPDGPWLSRLYAVGQPMGAYSSWALLALAHHAIVQYCSGLLGRTSWFEDYGVVGDDIVIFDQEVAKRYREVMSELGVVISEEKSLISTSGVFEFCKRLVTPQGDVSGIPVKLLYQVFRYPIDAGVVFRHLHRRGFALLPIAVARAISLLSARSVDLKKAIRTYPVSIRVALTTLVQPAYPWWRGIWLVVHAQRLSVVELHEILSVGSKIPTDEFGAYGLLETTSFQGWLGRLHPGKWMDSLDTVSPGVRRWLLKSWPLTGLKQFGVSSEITGGLVRLILLVGTPLGWWLMGELINRYGQLLNACFLAALESMATPGEQKMMSGYVFFRKRVRDRILELYRGHSLEYLSAVSRARTRSAFNFQFAADSNRNERRRRRQMAWVQRALSKYVGTLPPAYIESPVPTNGPY